MSIALVYIQYKWCSQQTPVGKGINDKRLISFVARRNEWPWALVEWCLGGSGILIVAGFHRRSIQWLLILVSLAICFCGAMVHLFGPSYSFPILSSQRVCHSNICTTNGLTIHGWSGWSVEWWAMACLPCLRSARVGHCQLWLTLTDYYRPMTDLDRLLYMYQWPTLTDCYRPMTDLDRLL